MYHSEYNRFVRANSSTSTEILPNTPHINGDEAQKLYLEEIGNINNTKNYLHSDTKHQKYRSTKKQKCKEIDLSNSKLFMTVQKNDVETVKDVLDVCPEKINITDEFGWSLLMIACQANSIECVKELLHRGVDISVRDREGNSARSLVIRNKNATLATLLLEYSQNCDNNTQSVPVESKPEVKNLEPYTCGICNDNVYPYKQEHLSSTIHNINASKGKKVPTNYVIPSSNKGYQILVKGGWVRDNGLGPDGKGRKCPIKAIPKNDRKGLGHEKKKRIENTKESVSQQNKRVLESNYMRNRRMEINFRREFY